VRLVEGDSAEIMPGIRGYTGGKHTFQTPELPKGKPFVYEFRAEIEKDGKAETLSQKVTFNAGEPVVVDFTDATATRTALK